MFVIGGDGLERELVDAGFKVDRDPSPIAPAATGKRVKLPEYDALIVGRDTGFSYQHLHMACHILQTQAVSGASADERNVPHLSTYKDAYIS